MNSHTADEVVSDSEIEADIQMYDNADSITVPSVASDSVVHDHTVASVLIHDDVSMDLDQ